MAKRRVIIWTDFPEQAVELRDEMRNAETFVVIRDSKFLDGTFVEPADVLAFCNAARKDKIINGYKAPAYRDRYALPEFIDIAAGSFGEPVEVPALAPLPVEEKEPDALDAQMAAMSDEELKDTYTKLLGKAPHHAKKRDTLEKELREAVG